MTQRAEADDRLWSMASVLSQRLPGPALRATTKLQLAPGDDGERAGLVVLGMDYAWIGLRRVAGAFELHQVVCRKADENTKEEVVATAPVTGAVVWLRVDVDEKARCRFAYSLDGKTFTPLGSEFQAVPGPLGRRAAGPLLPGEGRRAGDRPRRLRLDPRDGRPPMTALTRAVMEPATRSSAGPHTTARFASEAGSMTDARTPRARHGRTALRVQLRSRCGGGAGREVEERRLLLILVPDRLVRLARGGRPRRRRPGRGDLGIVRPVVLRGTDGALRARAANGSRVWPGVAVADLTGDGTLEIVVGRGSDQLTVYRPTVSGSTISLPVLWSRNPFGGGEVRTLAVEDLESDGRLDVVVGRASGGSTRQLNVFDAAGNQRAGWPARRDGEPGYGWGMYNENAAVGDLNGDGLKEVIGPTDTHYITALDRNGNQLAASAIYRSRSKVWSQVGVHVDHAVDLRGYADCGVEHRPNFADSAPVIADVDGDGVREVVVVGQRLQLRHGSLHRASTRCRSSSGPTAAAGPAAASTGPRSPSPVPGAARSPRTTTSSRPRCPTPWSPTSTATAAPRSSSPRTTGSCTPTGWTRRSTGAGRTTCPEAGSASPRSPRSRTSTTTARPR